LFPNWTICRGPEGSTMKAVLFLIGATIFLASVLLGSNSMFRSLCMLIGAIIMVAGAVLNRPKDAG